MSLSGKMRVVIVSGVAGAGKSTALRALEDVGYYCVDNLPLPLLGRFVELLSHSGEVEKTALVVDAREGDFLQGYRATFSDLLTAGHTLEVLFLDASPDSLVRRFSETRRRHPLGGEDLRQGIERERTMLAGLRDDADAVVDTTGLNVHQLKKIVQERYGQLAEFSLSFLSFGFKFGLPTEADMVLDVRFLPNPYFVPELAKSTGKDPAVASFVLETADTQVYLERVEALLSFLLPRLSCEGRGYFTIALGCTGGRHRSVAIAIELARRIGEKHRVTVRHRDLDRVVG